MGSRMMVRRLARATIWSIGLTLIAAEALAQHGQSDLTGTWSSYVRRDQPGDTAHAPGYKYGTVDIDFAGDVTGGGDTDHNGVTVPHTGGHFSVFPSGTVSGSITNASGTDDFTEHQLDESGTVLIGVDTDPDGYVGLDMAVKHGGSFSISDLEGRWRYYSISDWLDFNAPEWDGHQIVIDDQGFVESKAGVGSNVGGADLLGAQFTIDSAGLVEIADFPEAKLKMTQSKQMILGVAREADDYVNGLVMIRDETPALPGSVLEGRWHYSTFFDRAGTNNPGWAKGWFELDAAGQVLAGSYELAPNISYPVVGGAFGITNNFVGGSLALQFDPDTVINLNFESILLNEDANFGAGGYDPGLNRVLTILVLPEPSRVTTTVAVLLALLALRSSNARTERRSRYAPSRSPC